MGLQKLPREVAKNYFQGGNIGEKALAVSPN